MVSERAQSVLKVLIERYLQEGHPIGSRTVAVNSHLALSPASIRHIMSDLEAQGYISSPHTSAGRIPTAQGLRFFVDTLLHVKPLTDQLIDELIKELQSAQDRQSLLERASQMLSKISQMAGLVTVPRQDKQLLRQIEFLPLSGGRVLVILVVNEQEVQNCMIHPQRQYSESELRAISALFNQTYRGHDLSEIRNAIVNDMHSDRDKVQTLMKATMDSAGYFLDKQSDAPYLLSGQTNLFDLIDDSGVDRLRSLFDAFIQKRDILHLLDQCIHADGVQIFIGEESGYEVLGNCSIVTAPYLAGDKAIGVIGVIGPTRMPYEHVIGVVDATAKILSSLLNRDEMNPM